MKKAALWLCAALLALCLPAMAEQPVESETELLPITLETAGSIMLTELPSTGLLLSGTGEPGMPLSLYLGDELLGEPVMSETGRWSLTLSRDQLMTWDDGRTRTLSAAYASDEVTTDLPLSLTVMLPAAEVTTEAVMLQGGQVRFSGWVKPAAEDARPQTIRLCYDGTDGAPGKVLASAPLGEDMRFTLALREEDAPAPDTSLVWVVGTDEAHAQPYIMVRPVQSTLLGLGDISTSWVGVQAFLLLALSLLLLGLGLRRARRARKGAADA